MKKGLDKKTKEDLLKELDTKYLSLRDLRFGIAGSKGKNVKEARHLKKDIARIKTLLNQNG
jgi:ribosomal protein L29